MQQSIVVPHPTHRHQRTRRCAPGGAPRRAFPAWRSPVSVQTKHVRVAAPSPSMSSTARAAISASPHARRGTVDVDGDEPHGLSAPGCIPANRVRGVLLVCPDFVFSVPLRHTPSRGGRHDRYAAAIEGLRGRGGAKTWRAPRLPFFGATDDAVHQLLERFALLPGAGGVCINAESAGSGRCGGAPSRPVAATADRPGLRLQESFEITLAELHSSSSTGAASRTTSKRGGGRGDYRHIVSRPRTCEGVARPARVPPADKCNPVLSTATTLAHAGSVDISKPRSRNCRRRTGRWTAPVGVKPVESVTLGVANTANPRSGRRARRSTSRRRRR